MSLSLQILRFANFSHAELLTWGAYLALTFTAFATAGAPARPVFLRLAASSFAVSSPASEPALLAVIVDRFVFRRLRARNAHSLTMVFASFGVALVLRNLVLLLWGPEAHYYTTELQIALEVFPDVQDAARSDLRARP